MRNVAARSLKRSIRRSVVPSTPRSDAASPQRIFRFHIAQSRQRAPHEKRRTDYPEGCTSQEGGPEGRDRHTQAPGHGVGREAQRAEIPGERHAEGHGRGLANVAWLWALARGGVVRIAPCQFAQPIIAVLFASLLLKEAFTLRLLLAAIIIVTGIIVAHRAATALPNQFAEA